MRPGLREKNGDAIQGTDPNSDTRTTNNQLGFLFHHCHRPKHIAENKNVLSKPLSPGTTTVRASLTVEAALALPLFLLLAALFFTFFHGQLWQLRLQKTLDEVCEDVAVWSYLLDFADDYTGADLLALADGGAISGALAGRGEQAADLIRNRSDLLREIRLFLGEKLSALIWQRLLQEWIVARLGPEALTHSPIRDGPKGLSLAGSTLNGRELDLVLSYEIESAFSFPLRLHYTVVQRSCRHLWMGTKVVKDKPGEEETQEEEESEEDICYVTALGTVYHTTKSCRILDIKILSVSEAELGTLRNTSGGKYYPCDRCAKSREFFTGSVIITKPGTRYHYRTDCPSLKRTIQEISLSEAKEKYRPCHYCGGEDP